MIQSVKAGRILDLPSRPTLSDGTAGGVEPDAITFPVVRELVADFVTVTEAEIAAAMRAFMGVHAMMIEGSAGVAVAAYLKTRARWVGKNVVVVLCGANIDLETLQGVLKHEGG
jgi:threonine dehydratase